MCPHAVIIGMILLSGKKENISKQIAHCFPVGFMDRSASIDSCSNLESLIGVCWRMSRDVGGAVYVLSKLEIGGLLDLLVMLIWVAELD